MNTKHIYLLYLIFKHHNDATPIHIKKQYQNKILLHFYIVIFRINDELSVLQLKTSLN